MPRLRANADRDDIRWRINGVIKTGRGGTVAFRDLRQVAAQGGRKIQLMKLRTVEVKAED